MDVKYNRLNNTSIKIYEILLILLINGFYALYNSIIYGRIIQFSCLILLLFMVLRDKIINKRLITNFFVIWGFSNIIYFMVNLFWSSNIDATKEDIIGIMQTFLLGVFILYYLYKTKRYLFILNTFFWSGIICIIYILFKTPFEYLFIYRLGSYAGFNPNQLGVNIIISSFCGLVIIYKLKNWNTQKITYSFLTFHLFSVSLMSGSRKNIFVLIVCYLVFSMITSIRLKEYIRSIVLITIFLFTLFYAVYNIEVLYNILGVRINSLISFLNGSSISEGSIIERQYLINLGFKLFFQKPFIGFGMGTFSSMNPSSAYTHNNYIEILFGGGILGFIIYYSIYLWIFFKGIRIRKKDNLLGSMLVTFIIIMLAIDVGTVTYYNEVILLFLATLSGMLIFIKNKNYSDIKS